MTQIVGSIAQACRLQGCTLVGGETSEQPGIVPAGTYVLSGSIIGVAERESVIDGSSVRDGDVLLAVASNGLHTNGYSLVRALVAQQPNVMQETVAGRTFLEWIMEPHLCYWNAVRGLSAHDGIHAMAHITGGGIADNLKRVLPGNLGATVILHSITVLPIFSAIRAHGSVSDADMLRTFNVGVGLVIVASPDQAQQVSTTIASRGYHCYPIGGVSSGAGEVTFSGEVSW